MNEIIVDACWDDESGVWVATSSSISGLVIESSTIVELMAKIGPALADLADANGWQCSGGYEVALSGSCRASR